MAVCISAVCISAVSRLYGRKAHAHPSEYFHEPSVGGRSTRRGKAQDNRDFIKVVYNSSAQQRLGTRHQVVLQPKRIKRRKHASKRTQRSKALLALCRRWWLTGVLVPNL